MPTTDENKDARTEQSREVANVAGEAYRAAVKELFVGIVSYLSMMIDLDLDPLLNVAYVKFGGELREHADAPRRRSAPDAPCA